MMTGTTDSDSLIDARAPRTNQALIATLVVAAWIFGHSWILALLSLLLYVGVSAGRRWIPAYWLYFGTIEPWLGGGPLEDERAPKFAQGMGATGLLAAFVLIRAGAPAAGWLLAVSLAAAALFAAATGICLGCRTYRLGAMMRRIRPFRVERIEPDDVDLPSGSGRAMVGFSHPLCHDCQVWERKLAAGPLPFLRVDVRERPDVARRYGIALLPTVFEVEADGTVVRQLAP